jgi:hypothetical protein
MSEALSVELKTFDIRILIVEPGAFRTNFLGQGAMQALPFSDAYKGTPVEQTAENFEKMNTNQIGDPEKGVKVMYEFILGEGVGKGKEHHLRLPIGSDCYTRATKILKEKLDNIEDLKEVAHSTDFPK